MAHSHDPGTEWEPITGGVRRVAGSVPTLSQRFDCLHEVTEGIRRSKHVGVDVVEERNLLELYDLRPSKADPLADRDDELQ